MVATFFYLGVLLLPGAFVVWISRITEYRFFFALLFSVAAYVLSQIPFRVGGGSLYAWLGCYGFAVVATWVVSYLYRWRREQSIPNADLSTRSSWAFPYVFALTGLLLSWFVVYGWIGAYTEVPSDFWGHLVRTQWELGAFNSGQIPRYASSFVSADLFNREYIHSLHALAWWALSLTPDQLAESAQLAMTTLFICSVFFFACALFPNNWSDAQKSTLAALATFLTVIALGIGNWAFIRYYAFAPVMLNLPLYFFGTLLVIQGLGGPVDKAVQRLISVLAILLLTALLHIQETIFLIVVSFVLIEVAFIQTLNGRFDIWPIENVIWIKRLALTSLVVAILLIGFVLTQYPVKFEHPGVLLDLGRFSELLRGALTLNPERQFLTVLGLSGIGAYVIASLNWRSISSSPYIVATLLLPFLTVFNPLFIEFWHRVLPTTLLWRFGLLIPSGFVLAYAIGAIWNGTQRQMKGDAFLLTIALALFIPTDFGKTGLLSGRLPSFFPLSNSQNIRWLEDVAEFLDTQPRQVVHTDPVTSYVLRGMTGQGLPGRKFYPDTSGYKFSEMSLDDISSLTDSGIVLLNLRNGSKSKTVQSLQHWGESELKVSRFYPDNLASLLSNKDLKVIWSKNKVYVLDRAVK